MTKSEFLERLKAALGNDLSGSVIEENVRYYDSYISEEVRNGRMESEVIAELGDPWVLARTVINASEGQDTAEAYYGYESERSSSHDQQDVTRRVYRFGAVPWWRKLILILAVVGVIMVITAVVGGIVSLLAPLFVPLIIIMIIIRIVNRR